MFKMMALLFIIVCLYLIISSVWDIYKKKRAEDDLVDARTESDVLDIEEETIKLEKQNMKRKGALYSKDEVEAETEA